MQKESVYPQYEQAGSVSHASGGLTKREYFAGIALQGLLASGEISVYSDKAEEAAVDMADRILKALKDEN